MVDAFATVDDLGKILNREFTEQEKPWITTLLEAASTYLREDVIGQQVYPQSTVTFDAWPDAGWIEYPVHPVVSVSNVRANGADLDYARTDTGVRVYSTGPVSVTLTYGYATPPEGLKRWACVLVSQALVPLELKLGLTVGGLSSVAIDDFRAAFADGGEQTGMALSEANINRLRQQYASTVYVGGMR
jgi:hypothetical protein